MVPVMISRSRKRRFSAWLYHWPFVAAFGLLFARSRAFTPMGAITTFQRTFPDRLQQSILHQPSRRWRIHPTDNVGSVQSAFSLLPAIRKDSADHDPENGTDGDSSFAWIGGLVLPLWAVYISNQWSRSSLYYLVDFSENADPVNAMNVDVGFTEAQYGVLASLVFTSLFAFASLAAGVTSDRFNRKTLTVAAAVVWSVATIGTSFSSSYTEVVAWRVIMGLACAFVTPPAYTLIAQRVPKERVSFASSLYGTGVALGGAFASLSILLDDNLGWREALLIIGIYGFVAAGIAALVLPNDPKLTITADNDEGTGLSLLESSKEAQDGPISTQPSIVADVQEAVSTSRVRWLYLGSFLRFSSGLTIGIWSASLFRQLFPDQQESYAVAQALITAVGGSVSGLLGGYLADLLNKKPDGNNASSNDEDTYGRKLWVPVVGSVLAAPAWYLAVSSTDSFEMAMAFLAAEYLVAECWFGPTISVLQRAVGPKIGGTAQGLFTLTGAFANVAPSLLGFLYGNVSGQQTTAELGDLLIAGVCFGYLSSAFCFAMSAVSNAPESSTAIK